jgi:MFS family permease
MLLPSETASRPAVQVDRAALWSICFALFAAATSLSSLFVILPSVGRELGMSTTQVGLVIAPAGLLFVAAGPAWGRFGANLPRGPVLAISLTAIGILTLLFGIVIDLRLAGHLPFAWCFGLMAACRLLVAIFAASILPTAQAHIAETSRGEARTSALALMGASFALGMVASPGVVALAARWGIVVPFYVVAASLLPAVLLLRVHVRSAGSPRPSAASRASQARTPLRALWQPLAVIALLYTAYGTLQQVTGFRMQDQFGLGPQDAATRAGACLMAAAGGLVLTQLILSRTGAGRGRTWLLSMACVAGLAGTATLATAQPFERQLVAMAVFGFCVGVFMPIMLSQLTQRAEAAGDQARVGGWCGAAQGLGMVLGPMSGSASYQWQPVAPYVLATSAVAVVCVLHAASFMSGAAKLARKPVSDSARPSARPH